MRSRTAEMLAILRMGCSLLFVAPNATEEHHVPTKKTRRGGPRRVGVLRSDELEAEPGAEAEHARRLQFADLVRGGKRETSDVALQDRLTVEHVEGVNRESQPTTPNVDVLRQTEVELDRVRLAVRLDIGIRQRIDA